MTRREFLARITTDVDLVREAIRIIHGRHLARTEATNASGWSSSDAVHGEALFEAISKARELDEPILSDARRLARRYARQILRQMRCNPEHSAVPRSVLEGGLAEPLVAEPSHEQPEDEDRRSNEAAPSARQRQSILATLGRVEGRRWSGRAT